MSLEKQIKEKILVSKIVKKMWLSSSGESINIELFDFDPKLTIKTNNLDSKWKKIIKENQLSFAYGFNLTVKENSVIEKYENNNFIRIKTFSYETKIKSFVTLNHKKEIERKRKQKEWRKNLMIKKNKHLNKYSASDLINKAIECDQYISCDWYDDEAHIGYLSLEFQNQTSWFDRIITIGPLLRNDDLYFGNVKVTSIKEALKKKVTFEKYLLIAKDGYFTKKEIERLMLKFCLCQDKIWLFSKMSLIMEDKYNIYKLHQHFKMGLEN